LTGGFIFGGGSACWISIEPALHISVK
jgi:hypothetical protein